MYKPSSSSTFQTREEYLAGAKHNNIVHYIQEASYELMGRRNPDDAETRYWQYTNEVRRNLLMKTVRDNISNEWNPEGEPGSDAWQRSVSYLRSIAGKRLRAGITAHLHSGRATPNYE